MNKIWSALAVAALAAVSAAQTVVYMPQKNIADQQISLRGWGSGTIAQTDELAFEGTNSIRVSSRNYFQGGIMAFGSPVDLGKEFADKSNMLRITFQVPDAKTTMGGGGGGAGAPANGGGRPGGLAGALGGPAGGSSAGDSGGGQGGGRPGGQGRPGTNNRPPAGQSNSTPQPPLSTIRMIVTTSDGKKSEAYIPISTSGKGERGWKNVSIPLSAITGFDKTNKMIKEIAFAGDSTSTFYVGEIRTINDTTPITGEARIDRTNLALGDEVTLTAYGYAGSSVLKYEWDFDSDGKVDAEGQYLKRRFRKPGEVTITLIVSDVNGLKAPYKTNVKIKVNP